MIKVQTTIQWTFLSTPLLSPTSPPKHRPKSKFAGLPTLREQSFWPNFLTSQLSALMPTPSSPNFRNIPSPQPLKVFALPSPQPTTRLSGQAAATNKGKKNGTPKLSCPPFHKPPIRHLMTKCEKWMRPWHLKPKLRESEPEPRCMPIW